MKSESINVGGKTGYIFEGEFADTYCFVPSDCLHFDGDKVDMRESDYVRSRWGIKNLRFNPLDAEHGHLFPKKNRLLGDLNSKQVSVYVSRLKVATAA